MTPQKDDGTTAVPPKLSEEELRVHLHDGLMVQIEPDLCIQNKAMTMRKLAYMEPEKRGEWILYYKECYGVFLREWPKYLEFVLKDFKLYNDHLRKGAELADASALQKLEEQISPDEA